MYSPEITRVESVVNRLNHDHHLELDLYLPLYPDHDLFLSLEYFENGHPYEDEWEGSAEEILEVLEGIEVTL